MNRLKKYSWLFALFGQLSHIWWNKLGDYEDERLTSNKHRVGFIAFSTGFFIIIVASVLINLYAVDLLTLYRMQLLILSLTYAISINLWAFLTYRFDVGN